MKLERRGYLSAGGFVPEVVLDHPEAVLQLHRDFLRAGSDVSMAFTYYAHREKMRIVGKEDLIEPLQKNALALAKQAAAEFDGDVMVAGDICNTNIYNPGDKSSHDEARKMFAEQVAWAAEAGVDFIVVETLSWLGEALIGLEEAKKSGLDVVVNVVTHSTGKLREGVSPADCCKKLEDAGADVVGMNCCRGPATMLPQLLEIRAAVKCPVAGISGGLPDKRRASELSVAGRPGGRVLPAKGDDAVSGGAGRAGLHPLRDGGLCGEVRGKRHSDGGRLLRRRPASCSRDGRGAGADSAGQQILAGHEQALRPGNRPFAEKGKPGVCGQPVTGGPAASARRYSTVTDFARLRGLSMSAPSSKAV